MQAHAPLDTLYAFDSDSSPDALSFLFTSIPLPIYFDKATSFKFKNPILQFDADSAALTFSVTGTASFTDTADTRLFSPAWAAPPAHRHTATRPLNHAANRYRSPAGTVLFPQLTLTACIYPVCPHPPTQAQFRLRFQRGLPADTPLPLGANLVLNEPAAVQPSADFRHLRDSVFNATFNLPVSPATHSAISTASADYHPYRPASGFFRGFPNPASFHLVDALTSERFSTVLWPAIASDFDDDFTIQYLGHPGFD